MSDESLCVTARRAHVNATAAPAQQVPLVPLHCSAPHEPQVMVDRFDARLLLTQNDAQSLREHASLDGTGVVAVIRFDIIMGVPTIRSFNTWAGEFDEADALLDHATC